tara:strand:+ start:793 stop:1080 length:288 start_codon:yes stop_codon:yes gene_type:complete
MRDKDISNKYRTLMKVEGCGDKLIWVRTYEDTKRMIRDQRKELGQDKIGMGNITEQKKRYNEKYAEYEKSWGGRYSYYECLLRIDVDLFKVDSFK